MQVRVRRRKRKTKGQTVSKTKSMLLKESRCMSPVSWVLVLKNKNVKILAACSKISEMTLISLLFMTVMALQGERPVKQPMTTSHHNYRKVLIRVTSLNYNRKRTLKDTSQKCLKMHKRN